MLFSFYSIEEDGWQSYKQTNKKEKKKKNDIS